MSNMKKLSLLKQNSVTENFEEISFIIGLINLSPMNKIKFYR